VRNWFYFVATEKHTKSTTEAQSQYTMSSSIKV